MLIVKTIHETRIHITEARALGKTIGLVPTMGALHEGHFSLIRRCRDECEYCVVSIFVNPTQFGPNEDLNRYPRPFEADTRSCREMGVDLVFAPEPDEMYPHENITWVQVEKLSEHLCGASRPDHFRGVCTVVAKLFNIIQPDSAYFGQKDAQQVAVIQRMVSDLNMPVEIRSCPIVREPDGLAMSSRNRYLNPEQRRQSLCLFEALSLARELVCGGQANSAIIIEHMQEIITSHSEVRIDYISIVDNTLLQPLLKIDRPALIALAVYIGRTRLIDNIIVDPPA
ncbi:MAG: pantoate--beta-alanine ligase [Sedimentisphaerales bacterium]|nr:pantoate--beta-alanine ligase [Sedimentisphaerales bacterium]